MRKKHVNALIIKPGPTESGDRQPVVGGEFGSVSVVLSQYWLLIMILLLPLLFLFYKKRNRLFPWVLRLIAR